MFKYEIEFWKYLLAGFSVLYFFLTAQNYKLYSISKLDNSEFVNSHGWRTCLALFSGMFCVSQLMPLMMPQVFPVEIFTTIIYFFGSLIGISYARTMKEYLYNGDKAFKRVTWIFLFAIVFSASLGLGQYFFFPDLDIIYNLQPGVNESVLFQAYFGDNLFIPTPMLGVLSLIIISGNSYLFYAMFRGYKTGKYTDKVILAGVTFSCLAFIIEVFGTILTSKVTILLIFAANILEVVRTTALAMQNELTRVTKGKIKAEQDLKIEQLEKDKINRDALHNLAAGVAHEINNPLFIVTSSVERLQSNRDNVDKSAKEKLYERIKNSTGRIQSIVSSLSDLGDIKNTGIISSTSHEIMNTLKVIAESKFASHPDIHFEFSDSEEIKIKCNKQELLLAIFELLNNAIQSVSRSKTKNISIFSEISEDFLSFNIVDTGTGINPQIINKITDPFFTTSEEGSGIGMGLTKAQKIATDHGGHFMIKNNEVGCMASIQIARDFQDEARINHHAS